MIRKGQVLTLFYETTGVYLQERFLLKSGLKEDTANKKRWAFNPSF